MRADLTRRPEGGRAAAITAVVVAVAALVPLGGALADWRAEVVADADVEREPLDAVAASQAVPVPDPRTDARRGVQPRPSSDGPGQRPPPDARRTERAVAAPPAKPAAPAADTAVRASAAPPAAAADGGVASEVARDYCKVVIDRATSERLAAESKASAELAQDIDARIAALKAAVDEHERWLKRRQEFQKKAQENLVKVFALMPAEAAAQRLAVSDDEMAAAVVALMAPKQASAVLGEMAPEKAARITAYMAGAASVSLDRALPAAKGQP